MQRRQPTMSVTPDPTDRQAGHDAGLSGESSVPPPEIADRQAYTSGHLAGREEIEQEIHRWQRARISLPPHGDPTVTGSPSGLSPRRISFWLSASRSKLSAKRCSAADAATRLRAMSVRA
jgi:hypothetical protein